jgi:YVTN family beta-propeller protein
MTRLFGSARLLLGIASTVAIPAFGQTVDVPERAVSDPGVITTRQSITPAGVQSVFTGRVHASVFGKNGDLWVLTRTHLYQLDWLENRVISKQVIDGIAGVRGLAIDPVSGAPIISYITNKATKAGNPEATTPGRVRLMRGTGERVGGDLGEHAAGTPAVIGAQVLTPLMFNNKLSIVDQKSGKARLVDVGIAPAAVVGAGNTAYVANWGGQTPTGGEASAPTGVDATADLVRIDAQGIALAGTVSVVDIAKGATLATISVGRHPTSLALNETDKRLYVANANDDSISVIDTASRKVIETIALQPFAQKIDGIAPTAITIDRVGNRLYIACGGINAVVVYDLATKRISGLIPTGWYPVSVALDSKGDHITVGTLLGVGSGQKDGPTKRFVHANRGTAHVISIPDAAQLASFTTAVAENNRMTFASAQSFKANANAPAKAVPERAGEASLIEHVVYIVKENRTYDQVFGDLDRGNGEPEFVMFGEDVTPNHRKLAREFVTLDNLYATGGNSANGHQWVTQANEVSYTLWPGYEGRSYPFDGTDPLAYSARGFIWDAALARGKSVAVFGEYAPRLGWDQMGRVDLLRRWKAGESFGTLWNTKSPIPPLDSVLVRNFPAYTMAVPDVVRARLFGETLKSYVTANKMPNLTIIQLPSDHTSGTTPGMTSPKAMVADNDLALGQIVEALSKSPFWSKMAIFVVEDDSQNGVDHVDGHRTVALAISPYTKRGSVDSTVYAHQSILKTIELMLGLPTLSLFDMIATDMRASFIDTPNLTPYTSVVPRQDLLEINPPVTALKGKARAGALASAAMRWDVPDAVPSDQLNRITWHSIKGWDVPYPAPVKAAFSPFQLDDEVPEID